ncbi:hypothetical protein DEJ21_15710 [Curtobacterium sp. MCSS17_006]|uniref:hypothetical protein n=1 Tax=Curtobacterium sp. MCSS17_006 TaxID=2175642 RepID=UPI000DA742A3|nr:hypothetical protein [Curtobacterium sp. MCSS17_006]PZE32878.1 hypothetical protein DEJ21_15710 [Curtobacterium sp. MCSS17_006]
MWLPVTSERTDESRTRQRARSPRRTDRGSDRRRSPRQHPARLTPAAKAAGTRAPLIDALFTATSALCVTGHVIVGTGTLVTVRELLEFETVTL